MPFGTLVNALAVVAGSALGLFLGERLPERMKSILLQGLGLASLAIGFSMALKGEHLLVAIGSLALGGLAGEALRLEERLEALGEALRGSLQRLSPGLGGGELARGGGGGGETGGGRFARGFVTASLLFCVGAMTVVGAIREGVSGDAQLLLAKSALDGVASVVLAASLGAGVAFASLTVVVVQGGLTLLGARLRFLLEGPILSDLTATGGLLIVALGLQLLEVKRLRVANFLPSLLLAPLFSALA